jgi:hypothetical protein
VWVDHPVGADPQIFSVSWLELSIDFYHATSVLTLLDGQKTAHQMQNNFHAAAKRIVQITRSKTPKIRRKLLNRQAMTPMAPLPTATQVTSLARWKLPRVPGIAGRPRLLCPEKVVETMDLATKDVYYSKKQVGVMSFPIPRVRMRSMQLCAWARIPYRCMREWANGAHEQRRALTQLVFKQMTAPIRLSEAVKQVESKAPLVLPKDFDPWAWQLAQTIIVDLIVRSVVAVVGDDNILTAESVIEIDSRHAQSHNITVDFNDGEGGFSVQLPLRGAGNTGGASADQISASVLETGFMAGD